jgi:hypothetical protein
MVETRSRVTQTQKFRLNQLINNKSNKSNHSIQSNSIHPSALIPSFARCRPAAAPRNVAVAYLFSAFFLSVVLDWRFFDCKLLQIAAPKQVELGRWWYQWQFPDATIKLTPSLFLHDLCIKSYNRLFSHAQ